MTSTGGVFHLFKIDVLRGLAILMVFGIHALEAYTHGNIEVPPGDSLWLREFEGQPWQLILFTLTPLGYGWTGVQLFFIISGFLIHLIYLRNPTEKFPYVTFFSKRFFRIYPPYLVILLVMVWASKDIFWASLSGLWRFFSHIFMVYNVDQNVFFSYNGSFWSLAVEVQLYIIYPLFLWVRRRVGIRNTILLLLALYFISVVSSEIVSHQAWSFALANSVFRHWGVWGFGAYLAENYFRGKQTLKMSGRSLLLFFIAASTVKAFPFLSHFIDLIWSLFYLSLANFYLFSVRNTPHLWERFFVFMGESSYSFYLTHQPIIGLLVPYLVVFGATVGSGVFQVFDALLIGVVCQVLAVILYRLLEKPSIDAGKAFLARMKK